jgi:hypothetical protein
LSLSCSRFRRVKASISDFQTMGSLPNLMGSGFAQYGDSPSCEPKEE